ncbi:hypothetical protein [Rhodococcus pseudokoreensis]|nr:hypothetical protein [Rhodococcus pseudokoreensis]
MGRPDDGEAFTIEVRTTTGRRVRLDELPAAGKPRTARGDGTAHR